MSSYLEVHGVTKLGGSVRVGGAKNAALPILISSLLTAERCVYRNVPNLEDVGLTIHLLKHFGASVERDGSFVSVTTPSLVATEASYSLVKALRASFWVLAPLLARGGAARVSLPGGDIIGARPVDIHLESLTRMGADIRVNHGTIYATAVNGLKPAELNFRFPSVGATHQILMAAALTPGRSVIRGAACEPEVVALADVLNKMGARVEGAGTSDIEITGVRELAGLETELIGDRIEAATYLLCGAACGGKVRVAGFTPSHLGSFLDTLREMGCVLLIGEDYIELTQSGPLKAVRIETGPFPGFATDIQAPLMAALTLAKGKSEIVENIYEGRFGHVSELCRMGAKITVDGRLATIEGVAELSGARVEARDIRAGAALVIAGLAADGISSILEPQHLRRGYENLEAKVRSLGGVVRHRVTDAEDFMFTGC